MHQAYVVALSLSPVHEFSKRSVPRLTLLKGLGVEGDAHCGATVKHRSRVARDPSQPNLRQVHLIHSELLDELSASGFSVAPAQLGENILTRGIDLLGLPTGTHLRIGDMCVVEITGLRNPCVQIERFHSGMLAAVLDRDAEGKLVRKAGVMGVVIAGGEVSVGDAIRIEAPEPPHRPLQPV